MHTTTKKSACVHWRVASTHMSSVSKPLAWPKGSIVISQLKLSVSWRPVPSVSGSWVPVPPQPVDRLQNCEGHQLESQQDNITNFQSLLFLSKMEAHKDIDHRQKERQPAHPLVIPIPVLAVFCVLLGTQYNRQNLHGQWGWVISKLHNMAKQRELKKKKKTVEKTSYSSPEMYTHCRSCWITLLVLPTHFIIQYPNNSFFSALVTWSSSLMQTFWKGGASGHTYKMASMKRNIPRPLWPLKPRVSIDFARCTPVATPTMVKINPTIWNVTWM